MSLRAEFFHVVASLNARLCAQRMHSFGQSAKIRLIQRGLSVKALADLIGRPRNSVSLVIHGRRSIPTVEAEVRKELGV